MTSRRAVMVLTVLLLTGCAAHRGMGELDPPVPEGCIPTGTFVETHDPGKLTPLILAPYLDVTGCRRRIVERAVRSGATHLVWLYDYGTAAGAEAWRCLPATRPAAPPPRAAFSPSSP